MRLKRNLNAQVSANTNIKMQKQQVTNTKLKQSIGNYKKEIIILMLIPTIVIISLCGLILGLNKENFYSKTNDNSSQVSFVTANVAGQNNISVKLELAKTNRELEQGLMNRQSLEPNNGMLFIFNKPQELSFWMKNTLIPLDIAFLNADKEIVDIYANCEPLNTKKTYKSSTSALYAVEMNAGWFEKNDIKKGDLFNFSLD